MQRTHMSNVAKMVFLGSLAAPAAHANLLDDVTLVTSISYQNKELSFDQVYSGDTVTDRDANNSAKFKADLPMVNFGFTAVYDKFFAVLKYETNLSDTSTSTVETDRSIEEETNLLTLPGGTIDVKRSDTSFTLGYNVWKKLNVFGGYLSGETELLPDPFCGDYINVFNVNEVDDTYYVTGIPSSADPNGPPERYAVLCPTGNRAIQQFFNADQNTDGAVPRYKQTYKESGPFLGVSYSFSFDELGSISISLAYALMDGNYKDNASDPDNNWIARNENGFPINADGTPIVFDANGEPAEGNAYAYTFAPFDYEGDSKGTSIAVTWTRALGESSAFFMDARRQSYSMKANDTSGRLTGVNLNTKEEMVGITAGVQFYF